MEILLLLYFISVAASAILSVLLTNHDLHVKKIDVSWGELVGIVLMVFIPVINLVIPVFAAFKQWGGKTAIKAK